MKDEDRNLGTQLKDVLEAFLQVDLIGVSNTRKLVTEQEHNVLFVPVEDLEMILLLYKSDNRKFSVLTEREGEPELPYKAVGLLTKYEAQVIRWDEYMLAVQQDSVTDESVPDSEDDTEEFVDVL